MRTMFLAALLAACGTNGGDDVVACGSGWSQIGIDPASVPTECAPECKDPPITLHDPSNCRVHTPYNTNNSETCAKFTTSDGRVGCCAGGDTPADGPVLFEECYASYP